MSLRVLVLTFFLGVAVCSGAPAVRAADLSSDRGASTAETLLAGKHVVPAVDAGPALEPDPRGKGTSEIGLTPPSTRGDRSRPESSSGPVELASMSGKGVAAVNGPRSLDELTSRLRGKATWTPEARTDSESALRAYVREARPAMKTGRDLFAAVEKVDAPEIRAGLLAIGERLELTDTAEIAGWSRHFAWLDECAQACGPAVALDLSQRMTRMLFNHSAAKRPRDVERDLLRALREAYDALPASIKDSSGGEEEFARRPALEQLRFQRVWALANSVAATRQDEALPIWKDMRSTRSPLLRRIAEMGFAATDRPEVLADLLRRIRRGETVPAIHGHGLAAVEAIMAAIDDPTTPSEERGRLLSHMPNANSRDAALRLIRLTRHPDEGVRRMAGNGLAFGKVVLEEQDMLELLESPVVDAQIDGLIYISHHLTYIEITPTIMAKLESMRQAAEAKLRVMKTSDERAIAGVCGNLLRRIERRRSGR